MTVDFPTHTIISIVVVMVALAIGVWFSLSQTLKQLPIAPGPKWAWRWGIALVLIVWLFIRLALAITPPGGAVLGTPYVVAFLVVRTSIGTVPLLISRTFRQLVQAIPTTWLVGLHVIRMGGSLFLALFDMKLLPAEFALPAGYGDMTVGLLALALVYMLAQRQPYAHRLVRGWVALGLLDFIVALITGTSYIAPFAARLAASGGSLLYLNYVLLIPTFGVPLFTLLHIYTLFQLSSDRVTNQPTLESPIQSPISS